MIFCRDNMDTLQPTQYTGGTTTANSQAEGRLKVDAGRSRKNEILKKIVKKKVGKGGQPPYGM